MNSSLGHVELHGLKLRKESLAKLDLPIEVFEGYLGTLNLEIPWAALKTRPVVISISDLFLLAGPKTEVAVSREEELESEHHAKMDRVEAAEAIRQTLPSNEEDDSPSNDTFISQLVTKIVDNLQVMIRRIHVRYEDSISNRESPFAIGITLNELCAKSTDENWQEAYMANALDRIFKLANLDSLAMYWMPSAQSMRRGNFDDFCRAFSEFPTAELRYLVKPVSGIGRAVIHKRQPLEGERVLINLHFNSIDLELDQEQYYDALQLAQFFALLQRSAKVFHQIIVRSFGGCVRKRRSGRIQWLGSSMPLRASITPWPKRKSPAAGRASSN